MKADEIRKRHRERFEKVQKERGRKRLITTSKKNTKQPKTSTGIQIREHLKKRSPDYIYAVWHYLHVDQKVTKMKYHSFVAFFKCLEKLGLVLRAKAPRTEPPTTRYQKVHGFKSVARKWYTLAPKRLNDPAWLNPQRACYPSFFKLTKRPRGRPPGSKNKKTTRSS